MSNRYWNLPGVRLEPGLCPAHTALGCTVTALALGALWSAALPGWMCLLGSVAVVYEAGRTLWRQNRYWGSCRVRALEFDGRRWCLQLSNGRVMQLIPVSQALPGNFLLAVEFRTADESNRRWRLLLFAGSTNRECWRRLRLALLYAERGKGGRNTVSSASSA